jgi:hypothetical protein
MDFVIHSTPDQSGCRLHWQGRRLAKVSYDKSDPTYPGQRLVNLAGQISRQQAFRFSFGDEFAREQLEKAMRDIGATIA